MIYQEIITVTPAKHGLVEITNNIKHIIEKANVNIGICNIFIHHTSASLTISENYDPQVSMDLEKFMQRLVPYGDNLFQHIAEGPDDMPAHVKSVLTQSSLSIPITENKLALGTWQGVFIWEHRLKPQPRKMTITLIA